MTNYINHIENCLKLTDNYQSKIVDDILNMPGMSGRKTRHFYNNICSLNNARYLEIGTWQGSSICSAMCNNKMSCLAIDNWSEFGGPKEQFMSNFNKFKGENNAKFIEKNCWDIDVTTIGKFNIYMYDGCHDDDSHYKALNFYLPCLDNTFIYLVDDWRIPIIREQTFKSIEDNNCKILYKKEIFDSYDNIQLGVKNDWHCGIAIFVLEKNNNE